MLCWRVAFAGVGRGEAGAGHTTAGAWVHPRVALLELLPPALPLLLGLPLGVGAGAVGLRPAGLLWAVLAGTAGPAVARLALSLHLTVPTVVRLLGWPGGWLGGAGTGVRLGLRLGMVVVVFPAAAGGPGGCGGGRGRRGA